MNEQQYFGAASKLAEDLLGQTLSDLERLHSIHERITSRQPTESQLEAMNQSAGPVS